jgi:large conductance mechanosensitive channel
MGMIQEFKEFAVKGNVMDMAVGVIIGGAFGKIVNSVVNDLLMPPVGRLMGNLNFNDLFINLDSTKTAESLAKAKEAGIPVFAYGAFLTAVLDFTILAFCIFLMVKAINSLKKAPTPAPAGSPTTKECSFCCSTIPVKATRCAHCTSEVK